MIWILRRTDVRQYFIKSAEIARELPVRRPSVCGSWDRLDVYSWGFTAGGLRKSSLRMRPSRDVSPGISAVSARRRRSLGKAWLSLLPAPAFVVGGMGVGQG